MRSSPENAQAAERQALPAHAFAAATGVAALAFALYRSTLLLGLDFGDTASFQTMVTSDLLTPRDGYPLYYAIGRVLLHLVPGDPAHVLNVASAVEAALAAGLLVLVGTELCGCVAAAAGGALLFAVSYTFWSQAIIAEVYALHAMFVALTLLALFRWERRPTIGALAVFFGLYALGFGNHLSMVLLLPGYAVFLLLAAPEGWRSMLRPHVISLAVVIAAAGALQYAGELRALWLMPDQPQSLADGLQHFWFDVTKSDWRETMVLNVPRAVLGDHAAMYWFDLRQQFGPIVPLLAVGGLLHLALADARKAVLFLLLYATNVMFAYGYNVGDTHVFFLPSHLVVALLAACGAAAAQRLARPAARVAGAVLVAYAATRAYVDYPALDRSRDMRPTMVLNALTAGIDDVHAILITDLNWQIQNGLAYFAKAIRPQVAYARMPDVLLYAPQLIADNTSIGRDVLLTARARESLAAAYEPLLAIAPDPRVTVPSLADAVRDLPAGTRYVLTILRPSRDLSIDANDASAALRSLTGGRMISLLPDSDYAAIAGRVGDPPAYIAAAAHPFRGDFTLDGVPTVIRMESWLASDTIRRMGFGHVIAARQHTLIVERGVSLVAFRDDGRPIRTAYAANIFAPQPRYVAHLMH